MRKPGSPPPPSAFLITILAGAPLVVVHPMYAEEPPRRGKPIFYRMVSSQHNARILPKTRSIWTQDQREETGSTGMADEGYTEFPFCHGVMDFTFAEHWAIYPRLVSNARASESHVNTADVLIDHVYEPHASVWGWAGHEFIQTFTASGGELVRICLRTACPAGVFRAALIENGPGGRQIGPTRTFTSQASPAGGWPGSTEYATVRWGPGQASLIPGRSYGIRLWRADGRPALPYLHATGNAYDGGMLYVDGVAQPESDLALWIIEEPVDLKRALIEGADEDGRIFHASSLFFVPRTPNIRLISLTTSPIRMDPPTEHNCTRTVIQVYSPDGAPIGGRKSCMACGPVDGEQSSHFLYAADELKVTPGACYRLEVRLLPFRGPQAAQEQPSLHRLDLKASIYGEPQPGALPCIYNLSMEFVTDSRLKLTWGQSAPGARTTVYTKGNGPSGNKRFEVPAGVREIIIPKLWASHYYDIRLVASGPTDLTWSTPVYRIRMPKYSEGIQSETQSPDVPHMLALAPPELIRAPAYPPLRYMSEIGLSNNGFEDGLEGWTASGADALIAPEAGWDSPGRDKLIDLDTRWGDRMAGISHAAGAERREVRRQSLLSRQIATTPGHVYVLSAGALTTVLNGDDGDTRIRLFARPDGGEAASELDADSSQWYWTAGRWMTFRHTWRAHGPRSTIGIGFFRRHDRDRSSAFVDNIHVYDLGPAPVPHDGAAPAVSGWRPLALVESRIEADEKVEAFLRVPDGCVITGLGARAHEDNITTLWLRFAPLLADGRLGPSEALCTGYDAHAGLEAKIELPPDYVATGFGAGIAPEWDVKRFGVWARPLSPDGTLGEEKLFRAGVDQTSGFEKEIRLPQGRVLTAAGFNCMFNDVNALKAESRTLVRAATPAPPARASASKIIPLGH